MTEFFWCLEDQDKQAALRKAVNCVRNARHAENVFVKEMQQFSNIPGAAFSYWAPERAIRCFTSIPQLETAARVARSTNDSGDDFRFIRAWWEVKIHSSPFVEWRPLCKGGDFSRYYADVYLVISWNTRKGTYHGFLGSKHRPLAKPASADLFLRPGLTWSRRTNLPLSVRIMPAGCNFGLKGPAIFYEGDSRRGLLSTLAIVNSGAFFYFIDFLCAAVGKSRAYDMGLLQKAPFPALSSGQEELLAELAYRGFSVKRKLDSTNETSHAFLLPKALSIAIYGFDDVSLNAELTNIQQELDKLSYEIFGLDPGVLRSAPTSTIQDDGHEDSDGDESADVIDDDDDDDCNATDVDLTFGLLSWVVGVAFGRFDWRLATGARAAPPNPDPFDPLHAKSPGMLPDGIDPLHVHSGILVDDPNHRHNLPQLIEEVIARIGVDLPTESRCWLQRDFFVLHLKQYSKSHRKAPIYWPLSTASGNFTLWLYYPDLTSQTLYTAINEFVEPKLEQVSKELAALRNKGNARSRDEDKAMEAIQTIETELVELRDTLLQIAPTYRPNHDDGVQIAAAPLWPLFRHKPWQKLLKETWEKLERGEYDWSYLAMAYWPDRVREKCKTNKSLAIAHGLEDLYEPPPESATGPGRGGRKRRGAAP